VAPVNESSKRPHIVLIWSNDIRSHYQARCEDCEWKGSEVAFHSKAQAERLTHKSAAELVDR